MRILEDPIRLLIARSYMEETKKRRCKLLNITDREQGAVSGATWSSI